MKIFCVNHWSFDTFPGELPSEIQKLGELSRNLKFKFFYPRFGQHTLPIDTDPIKKMLGCPSNLGQASWESFANTIDNRCDYLVRNKRDRPWLVWWSGGIDSTALVTALLKHPETQFRDNITICANEVSIAENPRFFYNQILPNFPIVHGQSTLTRDNISYYHVSGALSDQLCGPHQALYMPGFDAMRPYQQMRDQLTKQISKTWKIDGAWFFDRMDQHIQSTPGHPIENCADFFWWFNFTWPWYYVLLHERDGQLRHIKQHHEAKIQWYDSYEFQSWAWHQGRTQYGQCFQNPDQFKQELKDYTWEYTKDNYFRFFKMKSSSDSRKHPNLASKVELDQRGAWKVLDQDLTAYFSWTDLEHAVLEHFLQRN